MDAISWQPVKVELGDLKPWDHNPRQSTKKQAQRILASFNEFGQVQTVAISPDNEVYDGHQRLSALLTIHGKSHEIDARQSSRALTDDERKRLVLMLHAGASGEWNWDALSAWDMSVLQDGGFDKDLLAQLNRDTAALVEMLAETNADEIDDAEPKSEKADELKEKWGVERGQVWQLGVHRLMCGDSLRSDDFAKLVGDTKLECVVTDPPYELDIKDVRKAMGLFAPRAVVLTGGKQAFHLVGDDWEYHIDFIWKHRQPRSFPTPYQPVFYHHNVLMLAQRGVKMGWERPESGTASVIEIEGKEFDRGEFGHAKTAELFVAMMKGFKCKKWGDPYCGAGTSILAAEHLGVQMFGMELNAATCAVALERFQEAFGVTPELIQ